MCQCTFVGVCTGGSSCDDEVNMKILVDLFHKCTELTESFLKIYLVLKSVFE